MGTKGEKWEGTGGKIGWKGRDRRGEIRKNSSLVVGIDTVVLPTTEFFAGPDDSIRGLQRNAELTRCFSVRLLSCLVFIV